MPYVVPPPAAAEDRRCLVQCRLAHRCNACGGKRRNDGVHGGNAACAYSRRPTRSAQFGDKAEYSLLQGGSFESGAPGWSLSNAKVVGGNESYNVAGGSHSLAIQPTGIAVSPSFCVSIENPSFRFFARQTSGSWGVLNVILRWTDSSGTSHDTTVASLQSGTSWAAEPRPEARHDAAPLAGGEHAQRQAGVQTRTVRRSLGDR